MRKRILVLWVLAILLFAVSGCGKEPASLSMADLAQTQSAAPETEPTPAPTPKATMDFVSIASTPEPTPEPMPTPTPTPNLIPLYEVGGSTSTQQPSVTPDVPMVGETEYNEHQTETMRNMAVEFAKKMGQPPPYCENYVESFRTAGWPKSTDFSDKSASIPKWLYDEPVNRYAAIPLDGADSLYQTNAACVAKLGASAANEIVRIAKQHAETYAFFNYQTDTKDTVASRLAMVYPSGHDVTQLTEDLYGSIVAKEFHIEGFVLTDTTMLYRDADGLYRVRCAVFKHILHATQALYEQMQCPQGGWREVDVEIVLGESDGTYMPLHENVVSPFYNIDPAMTDYIATIQSNGYTYP